MNIVATEPPEPGSPFPKAVQAVTRLSEKLIYNLNGIAVSLGPWQGPNLPSEYFGLGFGPAVISLVILGDTLEDTLAKIEDFLELLIDDISFQLQIAVRILQLEVIDMTPPLSIGMTRQILLYPFPNGYQSPKFMMSNALTEVYTEFIPNLQTESITNEKIRASLRWYTKGLAAAADPDKFAFYWIVVEILASQSNTAVEILYVAKCGHEIPECPICGTKTTKRVFGETVQKFLTEKIGLDQPEAKALWNMRQMFHGANHLTKRATKDLSRLTIILRYAALEALKQAMGLPQDHLPIISSDGPAVSSNFALGGTREVFEYDLLH